MTDTHCHILYDIDDGSRSIEESIKLLKKMQQVGFKNVILTPHYINDSTYNANNDLKKEHLKKLKEAIELEKLNINIFLGNEIYINNDILTFLKEDKITGLNNSKYLLIELPFNNQILNLEDILYEISISGYIPVIAHPERYRYFQDNHDLVDKLKEMNVLFQSNYSSIIGYYGKSAQKLLKYMLKKGYIDFLGTDVHRIDKCSVLDDFEKIKAKIIKITGETYFKKIMKNNNNLID